jgi:4-amino-4-deoxy-L-arabinose transferase-like glycosyltransferase
MTREMKPEQILAAFIGFQLCLLTLLPYAISSAPPVDVSEGWIWAPHWLLGTYKHPPMPAWLLEIMHAVVPDPLLGPYLLAQLCVALTYVFVYSLGRLFMGPISAAAGTLLLAGSYYFTVPSIQFNHNILQLPFWSGLILILAHLRIKPASWGLWLALGAVGGAGLYAKYSVAVLLAVFVLVILTERPLRDQLFTPRPYAAALLAALIVAPEAWFLLTSDLEAFHYAVSRAQQVASPFGPVRFLGAQILNNAPMLLLLALAWPRSLLSAPTATLPARDMTFLRVVTLGPVLLTVAIALVLGLGLREKWAIPMFTPLGLLVVAEVGHEWSTRGVRRLALLSTAAVILGGVVIVTQAEWRAKGRVAEMRWPMRELAAKADALWREREGTTLRIVGGDMWLVGLVAAGSPEPPAAILGASLSHSPWLSDADVKANGVLFLSTSAKARPQYCGPLAEEGVIRLDNPALPLIHAWICPPAAPAILTREILQNQLSSPS